MLVVPPASPDREASPRTSILPLAGIEMVPHNASTFSQQSWALVQKSLGNRRGKSMTHTGWSPAISVFGKTLDLDPAQGRDTGHSEIYLAVLISSLEKKSREEPRRRGLFRESEQTANRIAP